MSAYEGSSLHPDEVERLASGPTVAGVVGENFPRLVVGVLSKIPPDLVKVCLTKVLTEDEERRLRAMLVAVPQDERITDALLQLTDDVVAALARFVDAIGSDVACAVLLAGTNAASRAKA